MYKQSGIYCYQNLINGKKYIGQSCNLVKRYRTFKQPGFRYAGSLINKARKKYGIENFQFTILTHCRREELNYWEKFYIKRLKTNDERYGYNLTDGGDSKYQLSDHTKNLIRESWNPERRKKQSEAQKGKNNYNYGKHWNNELKGRMSSYRKKLNNERFFSEHNATIKEMEVNVSEYIRQHGIISYTNIAEQFGLSPVYTKRICDNINYKPETGCHCRKTILQCDRNNHNIVLNVFPSLSEAERLTGIHAIKHCVIGHQHSSGGYYWKYSDDAIFTGEYNLDFLKPQEDRRKLTDDVKQKLKENGMWNNTWSTKKVYVYTINGELYKTFDSVAIAGEYFKCDSSNISVICNGGAQKTLFKKYTCSYTELTPNEVRIKIHSNIEKPVVQLDFEGNLIKRWECAYKAAKELNIKSFGNISNSCKKKTATCNGYKWMFETDYNENGPIIINSLDKNGRIIQQIDKEGNIIKIFQSIAEVGRNGFSMCSVRSCCIGKQKEHKGFIWKYMN